MGVQVGLEVYRRRPGAIRALVLVCGTYGRPFETAFNWKGSGLLLPAAARAFSRIPAGAFWIGRSRGVHPRFFGWARRAGLVAGCIDEDLFSRLLSEFGDQDIRVYTTLLRELGEHDATDVLVDVSVPTLIVAGEADHFTPRRVAEKMARRIRGAEMTMVPGGTHFVPLEQPELVNLRTEKFLCDHEVLDPGSRARPRPMRADADPAA
jgi:pimeloyl-ACP methyl ester carboxylesterase